MRPIVLFDFDGVLFRGDAFSALMQTHCSRQWWRIVLASPLLLLTAPLWLLRPLRKRLIHLLVRLALLGFSVARYRDLAQSFGYSLAQDARRFSKPALDALNAHRHASARVIVVTGCEEQLARAILDGLGLREIELVASRLVTGRLGPRVEVHNIGLQKVHQLRLQGVRPPWDIAYGDSFADLDLLAGARSAVLVNPDRKLLARLSSRLKRRLSTVEW